MEVDSGNFCRCKILLVNTKPSFCHLNKFTVCMKYNSTLFLIVPLVCPCHAVHTKNQIDHFPLLFRCLSASNLIDYNDYLLFRLFFQIDKHKQKSIKICRSITLIQFWIKSIFVTLHCCATLLQLILFLGAFFLVIVVMRCGTKSVKLSGNGKQF